MSADLSAEIVFTGRLLLGGAFVFAGIRNIFNASLLTHLMSTRGVPWAREVLWLGIVLQIAAGALLIAGIWTGFAAAGLILFLLAATPMSMISGTIKAPSGRRRSTASWATPRWLGDFSSSWPAHLNRYAGCRLVRRPWFRT